MGMTIDEAIRYYKDKNVVLTEEEALANTIAINIIRKYQKIEEVYKKYLNDMVTNIYADKKFVEALERIFENENYD